MTIGYLIAAGVGVVPFHMWSLFFTAPVDVLIMQCVAGRLIPSDREV